MECSHCQNRGDAPLGALLYTAPLKIKTSVCFFKNSTSRMYFSWGPLHGSSEVFLGKLVSAPCWLSGAWWCVGVLSWSNGLQGQSALLIHGFCICKLSTCYRSFVTPDQCPGALTVCHGHVQRGLVWLCSFVPVLLPRRPNAGGERRWAVRCQTLLAPGHMWTGLGPSSNARVRTGLGWLA